MDGDWGNLSGSGFGQGPYSKSQGSYGVSTNYQGANNTSADYYPQARQDTQKGTTKGDGSRRKTSDKFKVTDNEGGEGRDWSDFEMQAVLALLCKRVHLKKGGALTFATALNEALNGKVGSRDNLDEDIDVQDVKALLEWIYKEKKGALEVIERQRTHHITRLATRVFARTFPFDGSEEEWRVGGRREEEAAARPEKLRDLAERMMKQRISGENRPLYLGGYGAGSHGDHATAQRLHEPFHHNMYDEGAQTPQTMMGGYVGGFASEARQPQTPIDSEFGWSRPTPRSPVPGLANTMIGGYHPTYSGGANGPGSAGPDYSLRQPATQLTANDSQGFSTQLERNGAWGNKGPTTSIADSIEVARPSGANGSSSSYHVHC